MSFPMTACMNCTPRCVSVDLNRGVVHGYRQEVTGQGPPLGGRLSVPTSFHFDRDSKSLTLDGHVRMTYRGAKT